MIAKTKEKAPAFYVFSHYNLTNLASTSEEFARKLVFMLCCEYGVEWKQNVMFME